MKITTKHVRNSLVTFVTHERSAVLFFLPSCCVNSLMMGDLIGVKETFSQILKAGLTEDSEARNEDSLRIGDTFNHENQGDENVKK